MPITIGRELVDQTDGEIHGFATYVGVVNDVSVYWVSLEQLAVFSLVSEALTSRIKLARRACGDNGRDQKELIDNFMSNGGTVWACPPCSKLRNYDESDFIDGVKITGAGPVYEILKSGASTISF